MMKKFVACALALILLFALTPKAGAAGVFPDAECKGYILCNAVSGEVLDEENADTRLYPASLTKMMTALLTVEHAVDLDAETATVSRSALDALSGTDSSTAGTRVGEIYSLRTLLYMLLLPSGNDCANVLAEYISGGIEPFAELMNLRARQLGMSSTHFVNPHGLHDEGHYTTARDMATLARAFFSHPVLKEISGAAEVTIPATGAQGERTLKNSDLLVRPGNEYYYPDVYGGKTGNTDEAGRCVAAGASRGGLNLVCVIMGAADKSQGGKTVRTEFSGAAAAFTAAFSNFSYRVVRQAGETVGRKKAGNTFSKEVTAVLKENLSATVPNSGPDDVTLSVEWKKDPVAPVKEGEVLGTARLERDGVTLDIAEIVAAGTVKANPLIIFWHKVDVAVYIILGVLAAALLVFAALVVRARILRARRRKRAR